jgi:hypothetical protein
MQRGLVTVTASYSEEKEATKGREWDPKYLFVFFAWLRGFLTL